MNGSLRPATQPTKHATSKQQVQRLTGTGESKFDSMTSKMATLTTSLEQKIDSKLGVATGKNMQKKLTSQQRENAPSSAI